MTQIATRAFLLNGSLAIVLLILSGMAAADRQKIHIQFHIVGQKFVLPPGDIDDINTAVAGKFSTAAEKQWGFIEWTSQAPAPANAAKWDITLRLTTLEVSSDAGGIPEPWSADAGRRRAMDPRAFHVGRQPTHS